MPGAQASKLNRARIGVYVFPDPREATTSSCGPPLIYVPHAPLVVLSQDGDKKVIREQPPWPSSEKMPCTALLVKPFWRLYK